MLQLLTVLLFSYQILDFIIYSLVDFFKYKISFIDYIQRFSLYNQAKQSDYLLYGVSCGEVLSLKPIANYLNLKNKSYTICSQTYSSFKMIKFTNNKILLPFDNFFTMFNLFRIVRPKIVFISERDIRLFFILWAKLFGCKIYFINYQRKYKFMDKIHYLIADKILLRKGTTDKKYNLLGDLKWLSAIDYNYPKFNQATIIIASANKEEIDIHINLIKNINNCKIIYVPRYLNWENELRNKLSNLNYNWVTTDISTIENHHINIVWSYGLLNHLYSKSHICIMGNTFYNPKKGGHNLVEPAINSNAIVLGPDYITCKELADKLCIVYTKDEKGIIKKTKQLIRQATYLHLGNQNKNIVLDNQKNIYSNIKKFI